MATTMKNLLTNIKTIYLAAKASTGVNHIKRGILPPMPRFPTIALLPNRESIIEYYSGGEYIVDREIAIEVYTRNYKLEKAKEQANDIITELVAIAQAQNIDPTKKWSTSTFDSFWGTETYETPLSHSNQALQIAVLPMVFRSKESMPSGRDVPTTITETGLSDLVDEINDKILTYINASDTLFDLTNVVSIYDKEIPPIPKYPAMTVVGRDTSRDRTYTSADVPLYDIELGVWTKALDKESTLDTNLDIVEVVKDVVQYNYAWNGKCMNSVINDIVYMRQGINNVGFVYRTAVSLDVFGLEQI